MLAPLKDRGILIRAENEARESESALRLALRNARQAQRRAATRGAREVIALTNEINRLSEANRQLRSRLDELESSQVLIALGQQLMALRAENDALIDAARRICHLERRLCAACDECENLASLRDTAGEPWPDSAPGAFQVQP